MRSHEIGNTSFFLLAFTLASFVLPAATLPVPTDIYIERGYYESQSRYYYWQLGRQLQMHPGVGIRDTRMYSDCSDHGVDGEVATPDGVFPPAGNAGHAHFKFATPDVEIQFDMPSEQGFEDYTPMGGAYGGDSKGQNPLNVNIDMDEGAQDMAWW
ncbi:hypothetical protein H072_374 [Dactylellina haptotyla CBS 200.50]|uniref:Uncharacterized protein n=1 Tax=Dactylellina haptotyla (strain CBS 200.50) TaxID=1284197 RepID=S8C1K4_DACHA|nr:hypothetical protein H072_374 [Dactylellina haptotyla CBS 200.50]